MSDSTAKTGGTDRQRISLTEDYERRDWAASLGCTEEQLRQAVGAVGDSAAKVRDYLRGKDAS